ncbi:MAG TPA: hypothetical protein DD381_12065 [Lentisphaeria bacterium]|nr:MAG: hypothetical protein A2X47_09655 [Lentisphaerae bacterium GWF2_38_69]HBM17062.1 hypothetical protein [Lentisphaeria bacterium]
MLFLKPIQKFTNAYDPSRNAFVLAIQALIPALISTAVYLYFRKPLSGNFITFSAFTLVTTFFITTYRIKIQAVTLTLFVSLVGIVIINVFYKHIYTMLILLFPVLLFAFSSIKYKYLALMVPSFIAISIPLPVGWYQAANRCIEVVISWFICLFCLALYELLFTKYRFRSNLLYCAELINDLFILTTTVNKREASNKIKHKYLFRKHALYRTDIVTSRVFSSNNERFMYKIQNVITKFTPLVYSDTYIFPNIKFFVYGIRDVFTLYRRLHRDLSLMTEFELNIEKLCSHIPLTDRIIENLYERIDNQINSVRERKSPEKIYRDDNLTKDWLENYEAYLISPPSDSSKAESNFFLGIKYIILDLDALRRKLRKIKYAGM